MDKRETVARVKPLEWTKSGEKHYSLDYGYLLSRGLQGWSIYYLGNPVATVKQDLEYAKAAAQADYEARILAAIEPAPVSVREAARVLLDAARIEPVHDAIQRSVRPAAFCAALRAIAEGKEM